MRVSKTVSRNKKEIVDAVSPWDTAIADAEAEISKAIRQVKRLRQAVLIFTLNKRDNVQWPANNGEDSKDLS